MIIKRIPAPKFGHYGRYRPYLRRTFTGKCAYCSSHEVDFGGPRFFNIDHFVPISKDKSLEHVYSNLLYTCEECNGLKGNDWHDADPIVTGRGYLDPCVHDYENHFKIWTDGTIEGLTKVADYMIEHLWLNRRFVINMRARRNKDRELMVEYDQQIKRASNILKTTKDPKVRHEMQIVVADLRSAKGLVRSRLQEISICRPESFWKIKQQTRVVPLSLKRIRKEGSMIVHKH